MTMNTHGHSNLFSYQLWLKESIVNRHKIAHLFDIKKVRPTHVADNRIVDDGYDLNHLTEALSLERLRDKYHIIGTDYDFMWSVLIADVEGRPIPVLEEGAFKTVLLEDIVKSDEQKALEKLKIIEEENRIIYDPKTTVSEKTIEVQKTQGWYHKAKKLEREGYTVILKENEKTKTSTPEAKV